MFKANKKRINLLFLISILLLISINIIFYINLQDKRNEEVLSDQTNRINQLADRIKTEVNQTETERRGFLITDNKKFINEHNNLIKSLDALIKQLRVSVSENAGSVQMTDSLKSLIYIQAKSFNKTVSDTSFKIDSLNLIKSLAEQDEIQTDNIESLINNIKQRHTDNSIDKISIHNTGYNNNQFYLNLITFIILILLITAWFIVNKSLKKQELSEKDLGDNRKWLSTILSGINEGLIAANSLGDITYINNSASRLINTSESAAIGKHIQTVFNVFNEDNSNKIDDTISNVLKTKTSILNVKGNLKNNKEIIQIEYSVTPLFNDLKRITGVAIIFDDITEQPDTESKIKKYQQLIECINGSIPNIVYLYNFTDLKLIYSNKKLEDVTGISKNNLLNNYNNFLKGIFHPEDYEKFIALKNNYLNTGNQDVIENEYRIKDKIGEWRWFICRDVVFKRDENGVPQEILGSALDVTEKKMMAMEIIKHNEKLEDEVKLRTSELIKTNQILNREIELRKQTEESLKENQEFLKTIIDINPNLIFVKDWDGKYTIVNKSLAAIYGVLAEELIGRTDSDFNPHLEETESFIKADREVMTSGKTKFIPEEKLTNVLTGETRFYQTTKVPLNLKGKKQVLGISTDITSRIASEEQILKSLNDKESLIQEIHHRIKNNLQIIISLLSLQTNYIHDQSDKEIFQKSRARVETMSIIHDKLYKKAGSTRINLEKYLNDLISHLLKVYKTNKNQVNVSVKTNGTELSIDTIIPLGLIINELFSNSIKYAGSPNEELMIKISSEKHDEMYNLIFKDNGKGMSNRIYTDNTNTLGLKIVKTLTDQLGGKINIENNDGTKVIINFRELQYKERV